jgi:hypothetical protein
MNNLKITNEMAQILNVSEEDLFKVYKDRQIATDFRSISQDKFKPYTLSKPVAKKAQEIVEKLTEDFDKIEIPDTVGYEVRQALGELIYDMSQVPLGESLGKYINIKDYLIGDKPSLLGPRSEAPTNVQPLPVQPQPNPQVVSKSPVTPNQQTGLTATETGLLTDAEKAIRLRQQGLA